MEKNQETKDERVSISGSRERLENKVYSINEILLSDINRLYDSEKLVLEFPDKDLAVRRTTPNYSFFENFGFNMSQIEIQEKTAFCVMPFHKKFNKTYESIKDACVAVGYKCIRSDEPFNPGNILRQILEMILTSEVIIAVLDGKNSNVFYEVGIAHSVGKTVILVGSAQNPEDVAFDIKSERLLLYNSYKDLRLSLSKSLNNLHYVE